MDEPRELPAILASDADREHSVVVLRDAVVEGRLTLEEFSERVGQVQSARTERDLAVLTADLPTRTSAAPATAPVRFNAMFSRLSRRGAWELPAHSRWRSWCGTIDIDLREVRLDAPEAELEISNVFGTVTVLVPPGIRVDVEGGGLFASQIIDPPPWPAPAGAPRLRIRASGPGGTLYVRTAQPRTPALLESA
jgi:hypothetical protein